MLIATQRLAFVILACLFAAVSGAQALPAFPGAEGAGSTATGGRGQAVYHVTNLNASGPGSLVDGLSQSNRLIVFDVSGVINLNTPDPASGRNDHFLRVGRSNITIAGQTAPGNGIVIQGTGTKFTGSNVVVRNLSIRPGMTWNGQVRTMDSVWMTASNSIFSHISSAWATDEGVSSSDAAANSTVQYSIVGEGLLDHSYGMIIGPDTPNTVISYHHNLITSNRSRNPRLGNETGAINVADFRHNVIYNQASPGYSGNGQQGEGNFVGNYYVAGPNTSGAALTYAFDGYVNNDLYQFGNKIDGNRNGAFDGANTGWGMFRGTFNKLSSPLAAPTITEQTADEALATVLDYSGAHWWNRTTTDARMVADVRSAGSKSKLITDPSEVGGWPTEVVVQRPANWDSDQDGMPNHWELEHGLDPDVANNNADFDSDGYTDVEEYLNDVGAWPAPKPIVFNGTTNSRYAQITNWSIPWQPSKFDTAAINSGTVAVDAVGQHAGNLFLGNTAGGDATLNITAGWIKVEDAPQGLSDGITMIASNSAATAALNLSGGKLTTKVLDKGAGGTFNFTGGVLSAQTVDFDLVNNGGTIAPGASAQENGPGMTHVVGDLTLNSGVLEIEIGGTTAGQYDQLVVDGLTTLGGTLKVVPINLGGGAWVPQLGDEIGLVASQAGFASAFVELDLPSLGDGLEWSVLNEGMVLSLAVIAATEALVGDYNDDGFVDAADFTVWRDSLSSNITLPNETESPGVVDEADYLAWKASFGNKSGGGEGGFSVPEPATAVLFCVSLVGTLWRRRRRA